MVLEMTHRCDWMDDYIDWMLAMTVMIHVGIGAMIETARRNLDGNRWIYLGNAVSTQLGLIFYITTHLT